MPTVVQLRPTTFAPLAALAGLIAIAAGNELVLVGTQATMADGRLAALRQALLPHRMVALLVDDHVPAVERSMIEELLNDGNIPVILTSLDAPFAALTSWIERGPHPQRPRHLALTP